MKKYKKIILILLLVLCFDISSKILIERLVSVGKSYEVIKNFFHITPVYNYGAAWSILSNKTIMLSIISFIAIIILCIMIYKEKKLTNYKNIYYGMILGGILGNLSNRLILGYVVDFFDFNIFGYNYPIFNLADCAIVISIFMMIIEIFKER